MKNCPFCKEEILDIAKKCKHCWELIENNKTFKTLSEIKKYNPKENNLIYWLRRFLARQFDILTFILLIWTIIFIISDWKIEIVNGFIEIIQQGKISNQGKIYIFLFYVFWIIESFFISNLWATFWKKIMWIKIIKNNWEYLSYKEWIFRTIWVYLWWLWLWIPIISPIVMLSQLLNITSKNMNYNTWYDKDENYEVVYKKIWFLRYLLIICIVLFICVW